MGRKPPKRLGYYGAGSWAPVYNALKASDAYRALTPTERLVLLDWIRVYHKASGGDMTELDGGFEYAWAVCDEMVSEPMFYRTRKSICLLGFFEQPPEIQSLRPGSPTLFMPSREWMRYEATADEAKAIAHYNKAKKDRLKEKQRRRSKFRSKMGEDKTERACRNAADTTGVTCRKAADTTPKKPDSHMSKSCRLNSYTRSVHVQGSWFLRNSNRKR